MKQHGLKEKHCQAVIQILSSHPRIEKATLFCSRVMQTYTPESDVDIALMGKDLTFKDRGELALQIEEINMAQSVDLVLYSTITNENLKNHVRQHGVVWYERGLSVNSGCALLFKDAAILAREKIDSANAVGKKYVGLEHIKPDSLVLSGYGYAEDVASSKETFQKNDILFGKLRPYFRKVVIAPFDGICSTDIWVVRAKKNVDQTFLYYWMASREFVDNATRGSEGTRMPRAKWDYVGRFESAITDKNEQITIGQVLKSLDNKIELNRQMCETLEKTAATLFKSWFVYFDPVKAKAALKHYEKQNSSRSPLKRGSGTKAGVDYNHPVSSAATPLFEGGEQWDLQRAKAYIDKVEPAIADLFPDSFEDSELGMIPKGWEVKQLSSEFYLLMGQSPPGDTYNEEQDGIPFFQGTRDFGFRYPSSRVWCSVSIRVANLGDALVSIRAPVGDVNMVFEKTCIGRGVAAVRHKTNNRSYTYYYMKSIGSSFKVYEAGGTVFGSINKTDFLKMKVIGFRAEILYEFEKICSSMDAKIEDLSLQIYSLTMMRDNLLPKLISGELRVEGVR